jgi:hypothetical protein
MGGMSDDQGDWLCRRQDVIRESCSCGATFEVDLHLYGGSVTARETDATFAWRVEHKHESQTVARDDPKVSSSTVYDKDWKPLSHRVGDDTYIMGVDYVLNGDDEPVWVSSDREQPKAFTQWARKVALLNKPLENLVDVRTDPSVYHS